MKKNTSLSETTEYWQLFERGKNHHNEELLYTRVEEAFRMYEGDQWYGSGTESQRLPVLNIISPTVGYKSSMIAKQNIQIAYNPHTISDEQTEKLCEILNRYAAHTWERQKMESKMWKIVKDACIAGDSYIYFYNKNLDSQIIDNTAIYFSDEQQPSLQKQEYIIIHERRPVGDIRREAEKNKIRKADIELILSDQDTDTVVGDNFEVHEGSERGKCASLLYFTRDADGNVQYCRSTRSVVYEPMQTITGLKLYPIASFIWTPKKNSARGVGAVMPIIPNQIEINRLLARRLFSAKQNAFAKPVYVENMIDNPADIKKYGEAIKLRGGANAGDIKNYFGYVAPAPMSPEASLLQGNMIDLTRNLASAGDAALGNVNPERASGAAILAIQDQNAIPLNEQMAMVKQFVEDIALIFIEMWRAYYKNEDIKFSSIEEVRGMDGMPGRVRREDVINKGDLNDLDLDVRVDATSTSPFSLYAQEQQLSQALMQQFINFEEYVSALPSSGNSPKLKYQEILRKRILMPGMPPGAPQSGAQTPTNIPQADGGLTPSIPTSIPSASVMPTR